MRYDKPGYGDPSTWAPLFGHPNDPRNDCEEEEIRLARLTAAFTQRITNDIVKDDQNRHSRCRQSDSLHDGH